MNDMNALASFDWAVAVYVASTIHEDWARAAELERRLTYLGAPPDLLENIRRGAGMWSATDDDRTEVIVSYAARFAREPRSVDARDIERLEGVGMTRDAIVELNSAVAFVIQAAHAAGTTQ